MITLPKIDIKAMKAKEVPLDKLVFPMIAQLKYDGVRLLTKVVDDMPRFFTYNGSEVPLPKLRAQILRAKLGNVMLDGEIVTEGGRVGTRPRVSGMINSAMHGGTINESILDYALFDSMHIDDFEARKCTIDYQERYADTSVLSLSADLVMARNQIIKSPIEVQTLSEQLYIDGFEGLILKPLRHLYRFSRSPLWVKIKETKTADLRCTGTTPGKDKYEGMIGAFMCEGIVDGKNIKVNVSGMTDAYRAMHPNHFIGKVIEVKYNSTIQDQRTGQWSLFIPRFNGIRIDK